MVPNKGESKNEFMSRFMSCSKMNKEYPEQKQRAAVAYSYWEKKNESTSTFDLEDMLIEDTTRQMSFKDYLTEFDKGDIALQQQHAQQQQANQRTNTPVKGDFQDQMAQDAPSKGDILQSASGKQFAVLGATPKGLRVRELGGKGKEGVLPHGKKFMKAGQSKMGKNIFKLG